MVYEDGETGILTVAIANRLLPGQMHVPPEWLVQLLAAFFAGIPLAEVEYTDKLAGGALRPDEDCFSGLLSGS